MAEDTLITNRFHIQFSEKTASFLSLPDNFPAKVSFEDSDHEGLTRVKLEVEFLTDFLEWSVMGGQEELMFDALPEPGNYAQLVLPVIEEGSE